MAHVAAAARPAVALLRVRRRRGGRVAAVDLLQAAAAVGLRLRPVLRAAPVDLDAVERGAADEDHVGVEGEEADGALVDVVLSK